MTSSSRHDSSVPDATGDQRHGQGHRRGPAPGGGSAQRGEPLQQAWLLSGRLVAGVGQLLLWILTGIGRLLRPLTARVIARLTGTRSQPPPVPYPGPGAGPPYPGGRAPAAPYAARPYGPGGGVAHDGRTMMVPPGEAPLPRWIGALREFMGSWLFAPLTGLALAAAALAELAPRGTTPVSVEGAFVVASTLPLVWRREFLRPVAAVVLGAFAAGLLSGQRPLVMTAFAALYTLYLLAQNLPRQSAGALAVSSVASTVVVYLAASSLDEIPVAATIVAVLAAIGLGDARRVMETAERTNAEANERTTETLTRLSLAQREQAVMRERARIARELHDVVAHSVSMIAVQAETAPYTMRELSDEARDGYAEIARTAREALVEMRRLLGVLRADAPAEPEVAPQPRLDRLPDLLEQHKSAGGQAELVVHGAPRSLSTTVELSAYRIVQEALTNARRHAPGSQVHVELDFRPDRLAVRVVDDGANAPTMVFDPGSAGGAAPMGPAGPAGPGRTTEFRTATGPGGPGGYGGPGGSTDPGPPGGHGLVGMRERATMLGGRFSAGPVTQGGFAVEAELPFDREESHPS